MRKQKVELESDKLLRFLIFECGYRDVRRSIHCSHESPRRPKSKIDLVKRDRKNIGKILGNQE